MASSTQQTSRSGFDPVTGSVAAARRFVRGLLSDWGAYDLIDDALLLVSELATNALVHAGTKFEVACADLGDGVRLEVSDGYPARGLPATLPAADPSRPTGRGLPLCAALSAAWGVEYTRTAKTVWCRLDLAGRTVPALSPTEDLPSGPVLVAVVGTGAEDRIEDWNPDAEALLGWDAAAVRDAPLTALIKDGSPRAGFPPTAPAGPAAQAGESETEQGRTGPARTGLARKKHGSGRAPQRWQGRLVMRHRDGDPVAVYAVRQPGPAPAGATWLIVPVTHRAVLAGPGLAAGRSARWVAFTDAELVRLGLQELLQRASDRVCDAFNADAAYVLVAGLDGGDPRLATSGLPERSGGVPVPAATPALLAAGGMAAVYDDLRETGRVPLLVGTTLRSAIVASLLAEGRPIGQICLASASSARFTGEDAVRLEEVADRLAVSVEARRIAEATRRHRDQLGFLAEASDLLAGTLDPEMTLAMLAQLVVPRLAAWCALWVQDARGVPIISYVWHADESRLDVVRAALGDMLVAAARAAAAPGPEPPPVIAGDSVPTGVGVPLRVDVPELADDLAVALPLRARGRTVGTAVLGRAGGPWFEGDVLDLAEELSRRAALALDNALLYRTQMATSRALQQSLLPAALPAVPALEIGVAYEAAGEGLDAGGDFYDVFAVGEQRWRFAIGDVSGNGPEAAAVTGLARHVLHLLGRQDQPLADAVAQLNQAILDQEAEARFLTVLYGEITPRAAGGMRVSLVVAGHPLPYLVEPGGTVRSVGRSGPLLGVLDRVEHAVETVHLAPGEALICVTDGVLERRDDSRTLGEDDLTGLLARCADMSAAAIAGMLRRAVVEYAPLPPRDDMAVLVLRAAGDDQAAAVASPPSSATTAP